MYFILIISGLRDLNLTSVVMVFIMISDSHFVEQYGLSCCTLYCALFLMMMAQFTKFNNLHRIDGPKGQKYLMEGMGLILMSWSSMISSGGGAPSAFPSPGLEGGGVGRVGGLGGEAAAAFSFDFFLAL